MNITQKLDYIDHVLQRVLEDNGDNTDILVEVARHFVADMQRDNNQLMLTKE
jgi:hypothetical protein